MNALLRLLKLLLPFSTMILAVTICITETKPLAAEQQSDVAASASHLQTASGRTVYVRWLVPVNDRAYPLIIFSHGAFSTPVAYDRLLKPIAAAGYRIAIPRHADSSAYRGKTKYTPDQYRQLRVEDIALVLNASAKWPETKKPPQWITAGHSFGALLAQYYGGATLPDLPAPVGTAPDKVVALSPPGLALTEVPIGDFSTINRPMLVVTGSDDVVQMFAPKWQDHLISHNMTPAGLSTALVFDRADHYFNGLFGRPVERPLNAMDEALVKSVIAFLKGVQTPENVKDFLIKNY